MTTFDRSDLNLIATCIDIAIKTQGVPAAKQLMPLWDKTETIAKEMDAPQPQELQNGQSES